MVIISEVNLIFKKSKIKVSTLFRDASNPYNMLRKEKAFSLIKTESFSTYYYVNPIKMYVLI